VSFEVVVNEINSINLRQHKRIHVVRGPYYVNMDFNKECMMNDIQHIEKYERTMHRTE